MAGGQGTPKSGQGRGGPALEMGQMGAPVNGEDPCGRNRTETRRGRREKPLHGGWPFRPDLGKKARFALDSSRTLHPQVGEGSRHPCAAPEVQEGAWVGSWQELHLELEGGGHGGPEEEENGS